MDDVTSLTTTGSIGFSSEIMGCSAGIDSVVSFGDGRGEGGLSGLVISSTGEATGETGLVSTGFSSFGDSTVGAVVGSAAFSSFGDSTVSIPLVCTSLSAGKSPPFTFGESSTLAT